MVKLSRKTSPIARRIKEARIKLGISQKRLGELTGIDSSSASARFNQYEKGKHEPSFEMLEKIANVLSVPPSYFYEDDDLSAKLIIEIGKLDQQTKIDLLDSFKSSTVKSE